MTAQPIDSAKVETSPTIPPASTPASTGFIVVLVVANLLLWVSVFAPIIVTLSLKVQQLITDPSEQAVRLSLVLALGSIFGIAINPLVGRLSDRTTARIGMRRPWLIAGSLITVLGTIIIAASTDLTILTVGWAVTMIGLNTMVAIVTALLPDHVPARIRGRVSGLMGAGQGLAGAVGAGVAATLAATSLAAAIIVPAVVALVGVIVLAIVLKDRRTTKEERPALTFASIVSSYWVNPRKFPDYGFVWISRFLMFLGISAVISYQLLFLQRQLDLTKEEATATVPIGIAIQVLFTILVSAVCGPLSDRLRVRKPFVVAAAVVGVVGLTIMALATELPAYFVAMALVGASQAIYFSVDLALVTEVLPDIEKDAAKDIGVFNLSNLVPQVLSPVITPLFLAVPILSITGNPGQNYTALYLAAAVFAVLSALAVMRVKKVR